MGGVRRGTKGRPARCARAAPRGFPSWEVVFEPPLCRGGGVVARGGGGSEVGGVRLEDSRGKAHASARNLRFEPGRQVFKPGRGLFKRGRAVFRPGRRWLPPGRGPSKPGRQSFSTTASSAPKYNSLAGSRDPHGPPRTEPTPCRACPRSDLPAIRANIPNRTRMLSGPPGEVSPPDRSGF